MGYKYVCNELYEYLISDDIKKDILFLTDDQFRDESIDLSDVEAMVGQPFLMQKSLLDRMPKLKWLQEPVQDMMQLTVKRSSAEESH